MLMPTTSLHKPTLRLEAGERFEFLAAQAPTRPSLGKLLAVGYTEGRGLTPSIHIASMWPIPASHTLHGFFTQVNMKRK